MNLYHYQKGFWFKAKQRFLKQEGSLSQANHTEKLNKLLNKVAKGIPFYRPYKNLPYGLWPILDRNLVDEQRKRLVARPLMQRRRNKEIGFTFSPSKQEQLKYFAITGQPLSACLIGHAEILNAPRPGRLCRITQERIFAEVCEHGNMHFDKSLYFIEPVWVDEQNSRMVPLVTTLTRSQNPLVRYRLDDFLLQEASRCACQMSHEKSFKWIGHADDILYVPHLFNKQLLPLYPDQLDQIMKKFPSIQDYQIVQQSTYAWELRCWTKSTLPDLEHLFEILRTDLLAHQMKCPRIHLMHCPLQQLKKNRKVIKKFFEKEENT